MSVTSDRLRKARDYAHALWMRACKYLDERAEKHTQAWGESIEFKRRYTNPEDAKKHRKTDEKGSVQRESDV